MRRYPRPQTGDRKEELTFSPIFDLVAAQYGLVTAAVYGVVHRHCLMRDGICRASTRRMASLLGTNHITIQRHIRRLIEAGYLEDLTPDQRNKPHVFRDVFLARPRPRPDAEPAAALE